MTLDVYRGRKTTIQQQEDTFFGMVSCPEKKSESHRSSLSCDNGIKKNDLTIHTVEVRILRVNIVSTIFIQL